MGKSRRSRAAAHRADPVARPPKAPKPPSDPQLAALRTDKILPVLDALRSVEPKRRSEAAAAVANIVHDERCRKLLLREQIVHIVLTETLTDSSVESRAAGWEILEVLVSAEESDFCVHLYRSDVLTAISNALQLVLETLHGADAQYDKITKAQKRFVWDLTSSVVSVLCGLVNARDEILDSVAGNNSIVRALLALAGGASELAPAEVIDNVLWCLYCLARDSESVARQIMGNGGANTDAGSPSPNTTCYAQLMDFKEKGTGYRAVVACAILNRVFTTLGYDDWTPAPMGGSDAVLVPCLALVLRSARSEPKEKPMGNGFGSHHDPIETLRLALEVLVSIGSNLQDSLTRPNARKAEVEAEVEAEWNGFDEDANGDDEDDVMAEAGDDNDEEEDVVAKENGEGEGDDSEVDEEDMEMVAGAGDSENLYHEAETGSENESPTLRELCSKAIPPIVHLAKTGPEPAAEAMNGSSTDRRAVRITALSALDSIALSVCSIYASPERKKDNAGVLSYWEAAVEAAWLVVVRPVLAVDTSDLGLAALVTSLARCIAQCLGRRTPFAVDELAKFMALYRVSTTLGQGGGKSEGKNSEEEKDEAITEGLGPDCIGVLGEIAKGDSPAALSREVGSFLMSLLESLPDPAANTPNNATATIPPEDVIAALNQLFDMYGDEELPNDRAVFWADDFLARLEAVTPRVRAVVKGIDKRTARPLRALADEALLNLNRFVQYKRRHRP